jgi:hypothetical protein
MDIHAEFDSPSLQNGEVIASLRRRLDRARFWFWICLSMLPASLLVGGVGVFGWERDGSIAWGIVAFVGLALLFMVPMFVLFDSDPYKRSLALAEQANLMELRFLETAPRGQILFSNVAGSNVLTGRIGGYEVTAMDYVSTLMGMVIDDRWPNRCFAVIVQPDHCPDFETIPKSWRNPGRQRIELPDQPEFDRQLTLRGVDKDGIVACFTPQVVEMCLALAKKHWGIRKDGPLLMISQSAVLELRPEEYPEHFAAVLRLADALRPFATERG